MIRQLVTCFEHIIRNSYISPTADAYKDKPAFSAYFLFSSKNQRPNRPHVPPRLILIEPRPDVLVLAIRRAVVVADADVKTDFISRLRDDRFKARERVAANQIVAGFRAMEVRLGIGNEQRLRQRGTAGAAALPFFRTKLGAAIFGHRQMPEKSRRRWIRALIGAAARVQNHFHAIGVPGIAHHRKIPRRHHQVIFHFGADVEIMVVVHRINFRRQIFRPAPRLIAQQKFANLIRLINHHRGGRVPIVPTAIQCRRRLGEMPDTHIKITDDFGFKIFGGNL